MMKNKIQDLTLTALMAAIICIMGPIVIPIGMVPMSFANMAIYLTIILLDKKKATISTAVYLLIGLVGLPVFSGFTGGAGKLFGPTGGYLIGYLALSWTAGRVLEKFRLMDTRKKTLTDKNGKVNETAKMRGIEKIINQISALAAGTICLYFFGTLWLMFQSGLTFMTALSIGVIPFIPFDIIKIIIASILGNSVKKGIASIL